MGSEGVSERTSLTIVSSSTKGQLGGSNVLFELSFAKKDEELGAVLPLEFGEVELERQIAE
ncbi:hypothetical protein Leryth_027616 [Lithospermum erythrorhizon]|nr:hypothetical protein Leryth_027616 [Lithospermum erythrorhizon]